MSDKVLQAGSYTSFSKSKLWDLNAAYYNEHGVEAWSKGAIPHQMSSNSMVGKTYAELILGYLKDLAFKEQVAETVYIIELGAGHGRLAYHILKHLDRLIDLVHMEVPKYCYVLTDIVEDDLDFFCNHPQFEDYFKNGYLDVSYFNAGDTVELVLRKCGKTIIKNSLNQSTVVIANYFFDSIPTDLFQIKGNEVLECQIGLQNLNGEVQEIGSIENIKIEYKKTKASDNYYSNSIYNDIVQSYKPLFEDSHIYFPNVGFDCLNRINDFSSKGMMLLSIDKGIHDLIEMKKIEEPELVIHGSFSIWVNYHAFAQYCKRLGGLPFMPAFAANSLECVCLLFETEHDKFEEVNNAYERFVNDFGPDDFNTLKLLSYDKITNLSTQEVIAMLRLSNYDSTIFKNYLPKLKALSKDLSMRDRRRLGQTMHQVWRMYYSIGEPFDLPFEIGGFFYDLSFREEALFYFEQSIKLFGPKPDTYYNMVMCHYQLRQDAKLVSLIAEAKKAFPDYTRFNELDDLNLKAN